MPNEYGVRLLGVPHSGCRTNCFLNEKNCLYMDYDENFRLHHLFSLVGLTGFVPYLSLHQRTGDNVLQLLREDYADLTVPFYTPRTDRLHNISVITAPIYYTQSGFLINRALLSVYSQVSWSDVFCQHVWMLVLLWRFIVLFEGQIFRWGTVGRAANALQLFLSLFELFANLLYGEFLIAHRFRVEKMPFRTIQEATNYIWENPNAGLVFDKYPFGQLNMSTLTNRHKIVPTADTMLKMILSNEHMFTVQGLSFLKGVMHKAAGAVKEKILVVPAFETTRYIVSFVRSAYSRREDITYAYEVVNELGLTDAVREEPEMIGNTGQPRFLTIMDIWSALRVWMFFVLACCAWAVLETVWFRYRVASKRRRKA